jgi:hypothetical protein
MAKGAFVHSAFGFGIVAKPPFVLVLVFHEAPCTIHQSRFQGAFLEVRGVIGMLIHFPEPVGNLTISCCFAKVLLASSQTVMAGWGVTELQRIPCWHQLVVILNVITILLSFISTALNSVVPVYAAPSFMNSL